METVTLNANDTRVKLLCPDCKELSTFTGHYHVSRESYGENFADSWMTCDACGGQTDAEEMERVQPQEPCEHCGKHEVARWSDALDCNVCESCYDAYAVPDCLEMYKERL